MLRKRLCNVTLSYVMVQSSVLIVGNYPCSLDTVVTILPPWFCGLRSKIFVRGERVAAMEGTPAVFPSQERHSSCQIRAFAQGMWAG